MRIEFTCWFETVEGRESFRDLLELEQTSDLTSLLLTAPDDFSDLWKVWDAELWLWRVRKLLWPELLVNKYMRILMEHDGQTGTGIFPVVTLPLPSRGPFTDSEIYAIETPINSVNLASNSNFDSDWIFMEGVPEDRLFGWDGFQIKILKYEDLEPEDEDEEQFYENSFSTVCAVTPDFKGFFKWAEVDADNQSKLLAIFEDISHGQTLDGGLLDADPLDLIALVALHPSTHRDARSRAENQLRTRLGHSLGA